MKPELLRNVAVFVEVAKARSFTKAASALDLPKSTVSRRIRELERDVGLRLLKRSTRIVQLTEEGMNYYASCRTLLEGLEATHDELLSARHRVQGHLRVAIPTSFALRLIDNLPAFAAKHPELHMEFDFTMRPVDPVSENCDIAICFGEPADSGLTARKLADIPMYVYASPAYLAAHGEPAVPADLSTHTCVLGTRIDHVGNQGVWRLRSGRRRIEVMVGGTMSFNSVGIIRQVVQAGGGLAILPEKLCRQDVQEGRLVRVLDDWSAPPVSAYALTATRLMPAKTRAFLDFVSANL
ncbi:LysR family transcriptional regulator [Pigmentiphaga sp. H8]|uniref:LysR family transcriptional regulator n=1 Tax=unclassified Pigmentiphaga TaxID=2626614 RepID=UPI000F5A17C1|nr:LysR family transcriptional regulator [Pigmentiphaga sp. H8]AZG09625.1 LysR family transcriptional regulator [Pigmentiphaga sp. H8]